MVEQKLPKEIAAKQMELRIYEDVIAERNINSDYLHRIQHQVRYLFFLKNLMIFVQFPVKSMIFPKSIEEIFLSSFWVN